MSNKQRNIEAVRIHLPMVGRQVKDEIEAAVCAIIEIIFGISVLPCPAPPAFPFNRGHK